MVENRARLHNALEKVESAVARGKSFMHPCAIPLRHFRLRFENPLSPAQRGDDDVFSEYVPISRVRILSGLIAADFCIRVRTRACVLIVSGCKCKEESAKRALPKSLANVETALINPPGSLCHVSAGNAAPRRPTIFDAEHACRLSRLCFIDVCTYTYAFLCSSL
jgi:hypothetical protein